MRTILSLLLVTFAAGTVGAGDQPEQRLFVSVTGDDQQPGTEQQPFATVGRAQQEVRRRIAAGLQSPLTVLIRQGSYELSEPLAFAPEDSGTEQFAVTYAAFPGETVVISGGRRIPGWQRGAGEPWMATVPGVSADGGYFRNLYVAGERAVRARWPNVEVEPNCRQLVAVDFSADPARFVVTVEAGVLGDWKQTADLEVMIAGNWAINRKRVQQVDAAAAQLTLMPPSQQGPSYIFPSKGRWYYLENAGELLDQPGEWYLDRATAQIRYWPRPGQQLPPDAAVAPRLAQLIVVAGQPDRPLRNLHFRGLTLAYTDWQLPPEGYMGIQACHYGRSAQPGRRWNRIGGAVRFSDAVGCSIQQCVLKHLGGSGIELADGCRDCVLRSNHIFDVSANGILIGGPNIEDRAPAGCLVRNNHVHACGREFYGAIGIWSGFARRITIAHNLVHDLPYSGISVGWEWNPSPTVVKENLIENNHVYDVMNRLCDGGCLYTLGFQPGTVIRGNHLHDVHRSVFAQGAPNNGMFIDEGSKGYLFQRNVIYNTSAELVRFNQCQRDWHQWEDNHFGPAAEVKEAGQDVIAKAGLESDKP